jgi:UDP-3-O-[3-hydroxymyristoyl] glucosamine N-acyltransferase
MKILLARPYLYGVFKTDQRIKNIAFSQEVNLESNDNFNYEVSEINASEKEEWLFIGNPSYNNHSRLKIFSELMVKGIRPISFVHERSLTAEDLKLGFGSLIYPQAMIDKKVTIGFNTLVGPNTIIHSDCKIGNNCFIGANVILEEGVVIGNNAYVCDSVKVRGSLEIGRNVVINDSQIIEKPILEGIIIDFSLGDFVRILS